jgi:hypothetical protein
MAEESKLDRRNQALATAKASPAVHASHMGIRKENSFASRVTIMTRRTRL